MKTKENIIEERIDKYPSIRKILSEATQHAYKVGEVKGDEYQCFYPEIEIEIDTLLSKQKQEMVNMVKPIIKEMKQVIKAQEEGLGYDAKRLKKWIIEWKNQLKQKLTK